MSNGADKLINEYVIGKKQLEDMLNRLAVNNPLVKMDVKHINSMIDDMPNALEWMKKGRRPGNLRYRSTFSLPKNSIN